MAMMRSPAFPPRRPSHLVRYIVPVAILLCLFYYLSNTSPNAIPMKYGSGPGSGSSIVQPGQGSSSQDTLDQNVKPPEKGSLPGDGSLEQGEKQSNKDSSTEKKPTYNSGNGNDEDEKLVKISPGSDHKLEQGQKPEQGHKSGDDKLAGNHKAGSSGSSTSDHPPPPPPPLKPHPIDDLIKVAENNFNEILTKESKTLAAAADAYRKRRGRHPPPGFDAWYQFAAEKNAVIVEEFFDQIYHDLNPFWGLEPDRMRKEAVDYEMTINIRNHTASAESDWFWTQIWLNMTRTIEHLLPDMDIALNAMDEPRLVVPWETIDKHMAKEKETRKLISAKKVIEDFQELPTPKEMKKLGPPTQDKNWEDTSMIYTLMPYYSLVSGIHAVRKIKFMY